MCIFHVFALWQVLRFIVKELSQLSFLEWSHPFSLLLKMGSNKTL